MHAKIAARRAWLDYQRQQAVPQGGQALAAQAAAIPFAKRKGRPRYTVQFGVNSASFDRSSDVIECRDARDAARLAANVCLVFGSLGATHDDDYWVLRETDHDTREWKSESHFVRLTRTYPTEV